MNTQTAVSNIEVLHSVGKSGLKAVRPGTLQLTGIFDKKGAAKAVAGILKADDTKLAYSLQLGAILARSWNPAILPTATTPERDGEYAALKKRIAAVMESTIKGDGQQAKDARRNMADRALAVALGYLVPDAKVEISAGKITDGATPVKSPARMALSADKVADKTVTNMGRDIRAAIGLSKSAAPSAGDTTGTKKAAIKAAQPVAPSQAATSRGGDSADWKTKIDSLFEDLARVIALDASRVLYAMSRMDTIENAVVGATKKANARKADSSAQRAKADAKRDMANEVAREIAALESHLNA